MRGIRPTIRIPLLVAEPVLPFEVDCLHNRKLHVTMLNRNS